MGEGAAGVQDDFSSSYISLPPLPQRNTPRNATSTSESALPRPPTPVPAPRARTAAEVLAAAPPPRPTPPPRLTAPTVPIVGTAKPTKQPVFVVDRLDNWTAHFKALAAQLGRPPNSRPLGSGFKFMPRDDAELRIVQAYLDVLGQEKAPYYAIAPPNQRPLKVAIRGLPADTPAEEITQDLTGKGVPVTYTKHIRARTGRPGCIFFAEVEKTPDSAKNAYAVNEVLLMPGVVVEAWRGKKGPSQCHRCQGFRHSSHNCHRPVACVRCGEGHFAQECPRPKDAVPTCANCRGSHTANSAACPAFKREARSKKAGLTSRTGPPRLVAHPNQVGESAATGLMAKANGPPAGGATGTKASARARARARRKAAKAEKQTPTAGQPVAVPEGEGPVCSASAQRTQLVALLNLFAEKVKAGEIEVTGVLQSLSTNG